MTHRTDVRIYTIGIRIQKIAIWMDRPGKTKSAIRRLKMLAYALTQEVEQQ